MLIALDVPPSDADLIADSLVMAELWGHPSHGLLRLPWYMARIESGVMSAVTQPEVIADGGAVTVIDGRDGIGQVLAAHAANAAIDRAQLSGVAAAAVRNSNHFGMAAYFTRMACARGCIGLLTTNASPAMPPWGGRKKLVGSNPWSVAAPAGGTREVILDIANTTVARGKIYVAAEKGEAIPETWALDAEGLPTTDPLSAIAGSILPISGHKGYGIAVMMDVLSGVLTGSSYGASVAGPYQSERRSGCGHLFIALRIDAFLPAAEFEARIGQLIEELKASPKARGSDEVTVPWELEHRNEELNRRRGVDLAPKTLDALNRLAARHGVESLK